MAEFAVLAELTAGVTIQATAAAAVAPTAIRVSLICLAYPSSGTAISNRPAAGNALRVGAHGANGRGLTVAIDCGRKVHPKRGIAKRKVPGRRMGGRAPSATRTRRSCWRCLSLGPAFASQRRPGSMTVLPAAERVRDYHAGCHQAGRGTSGPRAAPTRAGLPARPAFPDVAGKVVILVDDGPATGSSMR